MKRRRRMRAVHGNDIHARQHLVGTLPVGGLELALDVGVDALAIVVMDCEAEAAGTARQRLADAPHADDAHALALQTRAQHRGRTPAAPFAGAHQAFALAHAPCRGQHQRHRHVGSIFGEDTRRVGDGDGALARRVEVDVIDAGAEGSDESQPRAGLRQQAAVDAVGDGGNQYVSRLHGLDELGGIERPVFRVQSRLEQLHEPRLDRVGELPGDDHQRLFL